MFDRTVPNIELAMRLESLEQLSVFELPARYGWRFYRDGDEREWARIERSAGEFASVEEGVEVFWRQFSSVEALRRRMIFLTEGDRPFATATAWFGEGNVSSDLGRLHWVGIEKDHQGRNLCRPLVSRAMQVMRSLGHSSAFLTTQTNSWVAIRVYRQFGFLPRHCLNRDLEGWKIVSEKTQIDFTKDIR